MVTVVKLRLARELVLYIHVCRGLASVSYVYSSAQTLLRMRGGAIYLWKVSLAGKKVDHRTGIHTVHSAPCRTRIQASNVNTKCGYHTYLLQSGYFISSKNSHK